jgi:hypothetical protein
MRPPPAIRSISTLFAAVLVTAAAPIASPPLEGRAIVQQSLPSAPGGAGAPFAVQLLQDERLTNEVRQELARHESIEGACVSPAGAEGAPLGAFCASLVVARLVPAAVLVVGGDGSVRDAWSTPDEPVAAIAVENGEPDARLFSLTTARGRDASVTRLFTLTGGALHFVAPGEREGFAPLELLRDGRPGRRSDWRIGAARAGEVEILAARCEEDGTVTYATVTRDGGRWVRTERADGGCGGGRCFECDGAFPPRSRFP